MAKTADSTENLFSINNKLFLQRARRAFPILVRQAHAGQSLHYEDLALELRMPNPRNLNKVLGSIGNTIKALSRSRNEQIPPIQSLVLNKGTGLPGDGFNSFLERQELYNASTKRQKKQILDAVLSEVYTYPNWNGILREVGLEPISTNLLETVIEAKNRIGYGGGESPEHQNFKEWVRDNPTELDLKGKVLQRRTEYFFITSDEVDVAFLFKNEFVGVEVKAKSSPIDDIRRGLFQCIKYAALIEAEQKLSPTPLHVRTILALEGAFPAELITSKNTLGIEVVDNLENKMKPQHR